MSIAAFGGPPDCDVARSGDSRRSPEPSAVKKLEIIPEATVKGLMNADNGASFWGAGAGAAPRLVRNHRSCHCHCPGNDPDAVMCGGAAAAGGGYTVFWRLSLR